MRKWAGVLLIILIAFGCKKAFIPQAITSDQNHYLVIEGIVNSGNDSTVIILSRTQKIDTTYTLHPEANAIVTVESDVNNTYKLTETRTGAYTSAGLNLDGAHKYRLRIKTTDNKEYLSDFVAVKNSPPIDSVGFIAQPSGVQIYVNSHDATNNTRYYRWDYTEAWQFHSKYISAYYSNGIDSIKARLLNQQIYDCFAGDTSSNIVIASTTKLTNDVIYQAPITTIPSTSEKIETKYSILVKQYALTSDAYTFWSDLQNNTEKLGSIFDVLPSDNESNFHCVSNPNEIVVGYLSVGSSSSKRIFITADQLLKSYSPVYPCLCKVDTAFFDPTGHTGNIPFDQIIPPKAPYIPLVALYPVPDIFGLPYAYTVSTVLCVDRTVRGTKAQPAFWK